jgi:hypothetical protein
VRTFLFRKNGCIKPHQNHLQRRISAVIVCV